VDFTTQFNVRSTHFKELNGSVYMTYGSGAIPQKKTSEKVF